MRKRWMKAAAVFFSMVMIASLAACGSEDGADSSSADVSEAAQETEEEVSVYTSDALTSELSMAEDVQAYLDALDLDYCYDIAYTLAYDEEYWDNALGWRSAGSDAEHKTAEYLAEEMEAIGLTDVELVGVTVDKFQFNDSSLTIAGTDIDLMPASYQCSGTDEDGITAEIVNAGTGFAEDYEDLDVEGKIVLVGVDQYNESWIDGYIQEAALHGAAAVVSYSVGGYGELNDDTINVQDICCDDVIPTVAISANQAAEIIEEIEAGNNEATLMVDVEFEIDGGTSYNVIGKIEGKSSDQQILIGGHYDKYWYGFQDDSAAVALDLTVAKALIDSGYEPENDIYVVVVGSEEWGASGTSFDWTTGAWQMCETMDWSGSTLAMLNCELPAIETEDSILNISTVPEFYNLAEELLNESGLVVTEGDVSISTEAAEVTTIEDGVSYRWHGIPYFINGTQDLSFLNERYHTTSDDADTWDEDVMHTNLNWYGAFAIYIDCTPALELDITTICDELEENFTEEYAEEAGVDIDAYYAQIEALRESCETLNAQADDINTRYEEAVSSGASEEEIAAIRAEGTELNAAILEAYQIVEDTCTIVDEAAVYTGHSSLDTEIMVLEAVTAALEEEVLAAEDEESGALDIAWMVNAGLDYNYYIFSPEVALIELELHDADLIEEGNSFWVTDRLIPVTYVGETTAGLLAAAYAGEDVDYEAAAAVYQEARDALIPYVKTYCEKEMDGMQQIIDLIAGL